MHLSRALHSQLFHIHSFLSSPYARKFRPEDLMTRRFLKLLLPLLFLFAISPTVALAVAPAIGSNPAAQAPVTQAQITALQQAVASAQSAGDNAWMLTSAALVLLMTGPGLALFYGGLVRRKNILGTM